MPRIKIGMRNFKTAISISICLIASRFIGVDDPFFACITAIHTMQTDFSTSLEKGVYRLLGTILGSIIGSIFALVAYTYLPMDSLFVEALVIPIGIMMIIYILTILKLNDSVLIACVVFLSIMISMDSESVYIKYAIDRTISTIFGVVVAILVNRFIYPYEASDENVETESK